MAFQIKGLDLNTRAGESWMGLTRQQAKTVALGFIFFGLNLADFLTPIPNDVLNVAVASWLSTKLPSISLTQWFVLSYTVLAWGLIWIGAWIYPRNTHSVLNGYVNRFQTAAHRIVRSPVKLGLALAVIVLYYTVAKQVIGGLP